MRYYCNQLDQYLFMIVVLIYYSNCNQRDNALARFLRYYCNQLHRSISCHHWWDVTVNNSEEVLESRIAGSLPNEHGTNSSQLFFVTLLLTFAKTHLENDMHIISAKCKITNRCIQRDTRPYTSKYRNHERELRYKNLQLLKIHSTDFL